jgi:hypothetical protein
VAALLLAEREGPPRRHPRVTLTVDGIQLGVPYVELASEIRITPRWSLAVHAGGGARALDFGASGTTTGWELGLEPRYYFVGNFGTGFYLSWSTRFAREHAGVSGFETLHTPAGLSTGLLVGFKSVDVPIITPDVSAGVLVPLVVPDTEVSHPPVALALRFGIGFSF